MKQLYLFRHAKPVKLTIGTADIERQLTSKGKKDATKMARRLQLLGNIPKLIISSPANRSIETAHILANEFGYPLQKIVLEPLLYSDDDKKIRNMIKAMDDKYHSIMLVGHNPSLEKIAGYFTGDAEIKMTTASCSCIEFDKNNWKKITKAQGVLKFLDFPGNKAPKNFLSRQVRKNLTKLIKAELKNELKQIDASAYEASEEVIQTSIQKVVKTFVKSLKFEKLAHISKENKIKVEPEKPTDPGKSTTQKTISPAPNLDPSKQKSEGKV